MKKPEFLKRVLAGALGFMLVFSDVVPAMAAETQPADSVMEAEAVEEQEEAVLSENTQEEAVIPETETELEAEASQTEDQASEIAAEESQTVNQVSEAEPEPETVQTEVIEEDKLYAEQSRAVAPSITQPTIKVDSYSNYAYIYLNYTEYNGEYAVLKITASNTGSIVREYPSYESGDSVNTNNFYDSKTDKYGVSVGVTYTFTLTPYAYTYDDNDDYIKVEGTPMSVRWTVPAAVAVQGLAVKEENSDGFIFTHKAVPEGTYVYYEYSNSKTFSDNATEKGSLGNYYDDYYDNRLPYLDYDNLTPGVTYYVRAYTKQFGVQGAYSNVVSVKGPVADATVTTEIFDTAITLKMSGSYGGYTGFQVDRKNGKKYQNLTTTSQHSFKDTGLKKNTKYVYRVRAYYYNRDTKKYAYGAYSYKTAQTGTAAMNLRVQASGNSAAKLKWKKVPGAAGYDVYRAVGTSTSESSTYKSGENYGFTKYELKKSLGKKATSYTDKKLLAERYSYTVKAYKKVKGKKVYFTEESGSVTLTFSVGSYVNIYKQVQNVKNGKVTVSWDQVPQAKGYLIEKRDDTKREWVTQKKITKAKTTSYTFPASPLGQTIEYRIRAYNGRKYSRAGSVDVTGHIAAVTGVKAQATANGIKVSWKKVAGASYYTVYRTNDPMERYNADTKTYSYSYGQQVPIRAFKNADADANWYYTLGNGKTKMREDYETEEKLTYKSPYGAYVSSYAVNGISVVDYAYSYHYPKDDNTPGENITEYGPEKDVTYYYYVVAHKETKDSKTSEIRTGRSYGNSKAASAAMAGDAKKAPTLSKAKAGKKSVTLTIKKVKGAKKYLIYRSTSKKKGYTLVGSTTKTSYKDSKLKSKKTYYYKIKAVSSNGRGADTESSFSKVKSAKAK